MLKKKITHYWLIHPPPLPADLTLYNMATHSLICTDHNPVTYVIVVLFLESLMLSTFLGAQSEVHAGLYNYEAHVF